MGLGVVLTAGGSGARFGSPVPKQFLEIRPGLPLLRCALTTFHDFPGVEAVVVTLPPERLEDWRLLTEDFPKLILAAGGPDRWISVRNGVNALPESIDRVLIHDAARPFTPHSVIRRCVEALAGGAEDVAVIAAITVSDTVKEIEGPRILRTLDRGRLIRVQTPQGFPLAMLRALYRRENPTGATRAAPTDEAQIAEAAGFTVNWVEGSFLSRKITTPEDWEWAEWTLARVEKGLIELED